MKRVSVVVIMALLNAWLFGVQGSAVSAQAAVQDKDAAQRQKIIRDAKQIPPGVAVRIEGVGGIFVEGLFDRVNDDGDIEVIQLTDGHRETRIIPADRVTRVTVLRGRQLNSYSKQSGLPLGPLLVAGALLLGVCAGLAKAGK